MNKPENVQVLILLLHVLILENDANQHLSDWASTLKVQQLVLCIHVRKANKINNTTEIMRREEITRAEIGQYSFPFQIKDPLLIIEFIIIYAIMKIATFKDYTNKLCYLLNSDCLGTWAFCLRLCLLVLHVEPSC